MNVILSVIDLGNRADHLRFDELLRNNGIISLDSNKCSTVHDRMDRDMMKYGGPSVHQDSDPHHNEEGVRDWVSWGMDSLGQKIGDFISGLTFGLIDIDPYETTGRTDIVRVMLGHIVLDKYWANYDMHINPQKSSNEVMKLAFEHYRNHDYDRARYREV